MRWQFNERKKVWGLLDFPTDFFEQLNNFSDDDDGRNWITEIRSLGLNNLICVHTIVTFFFYHHSMSFVNQNYLHFNNTDPNWKVWEQLMAVYNSVPINNR
jgi:hypothetical protein